MRIAMLIATYRPGPEGGAERQCRRLAETLAARGHAVTVLTGGGDVRSPARAEADGVTVLRFGRSLPDPARLAAALRRRAPRLFRGETRARTTAFWLLLPAVRFARAAMADNLLRWARSMPHPFDVLHVHESGWLAGVGVALARRWGIPVVAKEATAPALGVIGFDTPARRRWDRRRRQADAWAAPTDAARDGLVAHGIDPARVHVIPNGVDRPAAPADPARSAGVLYVGNLTQGAVWKAFDVLFDAWIRVARERPAARLTVVGAGDPAPWLERLCAGGADGTVRFAGRVEDPAAFYRAAGIFVLPSRVEGLSNALLEAQSYGLACVASDIPGNRAVVADGVNGRIVPAGDAAPLADAIAALLDDPAERARLGAAARRRAAESYDMDRVADRVLALYAQLAGAEENTACA